MCLCLGGNRGGGEGRKGKLFSLLNYTAQLGGNKGGKEMDTSPLPLSLHI